MIQTHPRPLTRLVWLDPDELHYLAALKILENIISSLHNKGQASI